MVVGTSACNSSGTQSPPAQTKLGSVFGDTLSARTALRSALEDRSVAVQDAAARSLDALEKGPPSPRELNVSNTLVIPEVNQAGSHDVEPPASDRPAQGRHDA